MPNVHLAKLVRPDIIIMVYYYRQHYNIIICQCIRTVLKFPFLSKIVMMSRNESENNSRQCMQVYYIIAIYLHNRNERTDVPDRQQQPRRRCDDRRQGINRKFREDYYNNNDNNNNIWYRFLFTFEHGWPPGGPVARVCAVSVFFCRTILRQNTKA